MPLSELHAVSTGPFTWPTGTMFSEGWSLGVSGLRTSQDSTFRVVYNVFFNHLL